jgi:hypothetical protein
MVFKLFSYIVAVSFIGGENHRPDKVYHMINGMLNNILRYIIITCNGRLRP